MGRNIIISSVVGAQHIIIQTAWERKHQSKQHIYKNTASRHHRWIPLDLYLKWQLENDGDASSLSGLLMHLSVTHGSDCHRYVARVRQNSSIGTLYTMETYGWGGRRLPTATDPQP